MLPALLEVIVSKTDIKYTWSHQDESWNVLFRGERILQLYSLWGRWFKPRSYGWHKSVWAGWSSVPGTRAVQHKLIESNRSLLWGKVIIWGSISAAAWRWRWGSPREHRLTYSTSLMSEPACPSSPYGQSFRPFGELLLFLSVPPGAGSPSPGCFSASQPLFIFERVYLIDRGVQSVSKSLHSWGRDPHRVLYCSWHVLAVKGSNRLYRLKWLKDRNIHTDLHWQWIHREIQPLHLLTYKVIQTETSLLCHNVKTSLLFVRKLKLKCKIRQCHSSYVNQYCAAIFSLFHASNVFRNIYQCSV